MTTTPSSQPAGAGENLRLREITTDLLESATQQTASLRAELAKARDYEVEVTETLVKREAELAAARAECVALRESLQEARKGVFRTYSCASELRRREELVNSTYAIDAALLSTSASYSNLEVIDREALRKAVEALDRAGNTIYCNSWGPYDLSSIVREQEAALALLTKGTP